MTESHHPPLALAQQHSIVFHNSDSEYYVEGCGLVRLDNGELVSVVPIVPRGPWSQERRASHSRICIMRSVDKGVSWEQTAVLPYYSACPWVKAGSTGPQFRRNHTAAAATTADF